MGKTFRPYVPEQTLLLPPSLSDWLPEGHLARFVSDVVDGLDLGQIEDVYDEERGYPPYHPQMMVKVLLYGYATGVYSSRRLAGQIEDSVAMRFLAAENEPDFRTISDFRKRHAKALEGLFVQVLQLCRKAGLVKLGRVALDGTKVKGNASKHKAMSYGRMKQTQERLEAEVKGLLQEAARIDAAEDERFGLGRRGDELPAELARREDRLRKIKEAKAALEAEAKQGQDGTGEGDKSPGPPDKAQRNFTDPESKIQKTADGFIQGYNAQLVVDAQTQVIVAQDVVTEPDVAQLISMIDQVDENLGERPRALLADAGYYSELNDEALFERGIEGYVATRRQKHGEPPEPAPKGPIPRGMSLRDRMARKLRTIRGRREYSRRKTTVEPVIGQIKQARGFRQFLRRGLANVKAEWSLICTAHNLLKLFRFGIA